MKRLQKNVLAKNANIDLESIADYKAELLGSFLFFIQEFFPLVTGRPWSMSQPVGRESHYITVCRELTKVARGEQLDTLINIHPGGGKSTILSMWVGWTLAEFQNSQYLYISYSKVLSTKHTEFIRRIISLPLYYQLFGIKIRSDSKAKDSFQTNTGGSIRAFGTQGAVTGQDAGLPNMERFSGAVIIDDAHKPDEVHSDTIRASVIQNYKETILQRPRGPRVPIIFIGQRLHEDDLPSYMLSGNDERTYKKVVLKSIDDAGNALHPEVMPLESLLEKKEKSPYVYSSQYQQDPIPEGGALYKADYFLKLDDEPKLLLTFITADTAESTKTHNDATVFSFWGYYEIEEFGRMTGEHALHWLDCLETRVEPKDLKETFIDFYALCMLHPIKPKLAAIEKKSTGVTLISTLEGMRGIEIRGVNRTKIDGSKAVRYLEMQPYLASKQVTFTEGAKHSKSCIAHMIKITANDSHRWDDICDTVYDAVKIALIDKTLHAASVNDRPKNAAKLLMQDMRNKNIAIQKAHNYAGSF
jgi:predicted phage terminase large subunit-like protein